MARWLSVPPRPGRQQWPTLPRWRWRLRWRWPWPRRQPSTVSLKTVMAGLEEAVRANRAEAAGQAPPPPARLPPSLAAAFARAGLDSLPIGSEPRCTIELCELSFRAPISDASIEAGRSGGDVTLLVPPPPTGLGRLIALIRRWLRLERPGETEREVVIRLHGDRPARMTIDNFPLDSERGEDS